MPGTTARPRQPREQWLLWVSIALYVASLSQETFCASGNCSGWPGYGILLFGILGIGGSLANVTWIANPILFLSWLFIWQRDRRLSLAFSGAALIVAAAFMLMPNVVNNEGGVAVPITGLRLGYWLWLASMVVAVLAAPTRSNAVKVSG